MTARLLLCALCIVAVQTPGFCAPKTGFTVRPVATVTGREIRLRDVSDATGALGDLVIGAAAVPGRSCVLTAGEIRLRLRAARLDSSQAVLPPAVTVRTVGGALPGDALVAAAVEAVRKALPWPESDVVIEPVGVPRMPALRGGIPILIPGTPVLRSAASAVVPVTVSIAGAPETETRTVEVGLRLRVSGMAVVAARPIARHAVIAPEDVTLARVELSGGAALGSVAEVVGKRAENRLPAGRRLAAADVAEAPIIDAGAKVTVRVVTGAVEIATSGTAREEGRRDQTIRIRLTADPSRAAREVRARVLDPTTVLIEE